MDRASTAAFETTATSAVCVGWLSTYPQQWQPAAPGAFERQKRVVDRSEPRGDDEKRQVHVARQDRHGVLTRDRHQQSARPLDQRHVGRRLDGPQPIEDEDRIDSRARPACCLVGCQRISEPIRADGRDVRSAARGLMRAVASAG